MEPFNGQNKNSLWRGILAVIFVLVLMGGGVYYVYKQRMAPTFRIALEYSPVVQGVSQQLHAWYDPDGAGSMPEEDVTDNAGWSSDNTSVAYVGNTSATKGQLMVPQKGNAVITASFKNMTVRIAISVTAAPLAIRCYPVTNKVIKAGEQDDFIAYFSKIGLPDYKYQWETPDGQTSKMINPVFTFKTRGQQIVKVTVTDRAGSVVHADCEPLLVE